MDSETIVHEEALIGAMLLRPAAIGSVLQKVTAADFSRPSFGAIFAKIAECWEAGQQIDAVTVTAGTTAPAEVALAAMTNAPSFDPERYAGLVAGAGAKRRLLRAGAEIVELSQSPLDAVEAFDRAQASLASIRGPTAVTEEALSIDDLIDLPDPEDDWVIPNLLARGERVLLVAGEGVGKSVLWRQTAIMVAQGIHPFDHKHIKPATTLLVDLENPEAIVRRSCRPIVLQARKQAMTYRYDQAHFWHHPEGIDLRSSVGYAAFDQVLSQVRPAVVLLGPLYKLFVGRSKESAEEVALEVTGRLDELRTRYNFALMLEHHAPKSSMGGRDMIPFGSSIWMRWPEFGPSMVPVDGTFNVCHFKQWRGPREKRTWPTKLVRGGAWPWTASYEAIP